MAKTTAIRAPTTDPVNHQIVLRQLKEASETASRLRGNARDSFAQVGELLDAGIVRFVDGKLVAPSPSSLPPTVVPSTRQIKTGGSIQGGGTLTADLSLELVGDAGSPGNNMLYGTNATGVKGWYTQPGGGGGGSAAPVSPDSAPASPTIYDDEFEGSSLSSVWSWDHQNSATVAVSQGALQMATTVNNSAIISSLRQTAPAAPWTFVAKLSVLAAGAAGSGGLLLYNSANGKIIVFAMDTRGVAIYRYTDFQTYTSSILSATRSPYPSPSSGLTVQADGQDAYFQISLSSGGTLAFSYIKKGYNINLWQLATEPLASFIGAVTHIGLYVLSNLNTPYGNTFLACDWFRRTA